MDQELSRSLLGSKLRVRAKSPFFSVLAGHLKPVQVGAEFFGGNAPTAAVDGKNLFISKDFWMALRPEERDFVLVHEVLHAALGHTWRSRGRNPQRWNVACDYAVNLVCSLAGYAPIKGALWDPKYVGMVVEEIYELIDWPEYGLFFLSGDIVCGGAEDKQLQAAWKTAMSRARAAEKLYGSQPLGALLEFLEERSTVDWRSALWRCADASSDFAGWDRRLVWSETYVEDILPVEGSAGLCALCVDTSGSCESVIGKFVGEIREVANVTGQEFPLYWADAEVIGPLPLSELDRPMGGGGTSFVPFFDEVEKCGYKRVVYLTDLCGTFPERTDADVLWVVPPGTSIQPPFGRVVKVLG